MTSVGLNLLFLLFISRNLQMSKDGLSTYKQTILVLESRQALMPKKNLQRTLGIFCNWLPCDFDGTESAFLYRWCLYCLLSFDINSFSRSVSIVADLVLHIQAYIDVPPLTETWQQNLVSVIAYLRAFLARLHCFHSSHLNFCLFYHLINLYFLIVLSTNPQAE